MKYEEISKLDTAKRQLIVAIRMFFERKDLIAIHTLAAASQGILIDLAKTKDIKSLLIDCEIIRAEKRDEVNQMFREAQNFFKHADRDPESLFKYYPDITSFFLFDACQLYEKLINSKIPETKVFCGWFYIKYPDILMEGQIKDQLNKLKKVIDINDFELALHAIEYFSQNPDMTDIS